MSLTLKDLRVRYKCDDCPEGCDGQHYYPASLVSLVEVLKQEGAVRIDLLGRSYEFSERGRYLILPLGDTPK